RLGHHRAQQSAHQMDGPLLELVATSVILVELAIGEREAPHGEDAVDVVSHPRVLIVAMHGDRGARGKQTAERTLFAPNYALDVAKVPIELLPQTRLTHEHALPTSAELRKYGDAPRDGTVHPTSRYAASRCSFFLAFPWRLPHAGRQPCISALPCSSFDSSSSSRSLDLQGVYVAERRNEHQPAKAPKPHGSGALFVWAPGSPRGDP